jgi:hypothetical protein
MTWQGLGIAFAMMAYVGSLMFLAGVGAHYSVEPGPNHKLISGVAWAIFVAIIFFSLALAASVRF